MKIEGHQEAALAYLGSLDNLEFTPCAGGLINPSFQVTNTKSHRSFFLQQINTQVFPDPAILQENYMLLWEHFSLSPPTLRIAQPYLFPNGNSFFIDTNKGIWRVAEFIENSTHFQTALQEEQLKKAAWAFGIYAKNLSSIEPQKVKSLIPRFHDLQYRWNQFQEAVKSGDNARVDETQGLINELIKREFYLVQYLKMRKLPDQFPIRLLHHDAKIANLLFDKPGENVIAVIDLDTTMPGLFFSDVGDMIRSMVCEQGEQSIEWEKLKIYPKRYKLLTEGYLESMSEVLTTKEKESIHYSGLLMLYMQTLRFISDYLTGDHYYRTERPGQNRDRALNQFTLLKSLEQFLKDEYSFSTI